MEKNSFVFVFFHTCYLVWPTAQSKLNTWVLNFTLFSWSIYTLYIVPQMRSNYKHNHSTDSNAKNYTHTAMSMLLCCPHKVYASMHTSKTHYGGNFTCSCVYCKYMLDVSKLLCCLFCFNGCERNIHA